MPPPTTRRILLPPLPLLILLAARGYSRRSGSATRATLATFGDAGEFRRALRLFAQMRKSASLFGRDASSSSSSSSSSSRTGAAAVAPSSLPVDDRSSSVDDGDGGDDVVVVVGIRVDLVPEPPKPTLVTYSALMSRAPSVSRGWRCDCGISCRTRGTSTPASTRKEEGGENGRDDARRRRYPGRDILQHAHERVRQTRRSRVGEVRPACHGRRRRRRRRRFSSTPRRHTPHRTDRGDLQHARGRLQGGGELGAALEVPDLMIAHAGSTGAESLLPTLAPTPYLISTVARKSTGAGRRRRRRRPRRGDARGPPER
ncbi:LOW QUALITY PROTEIN: hypothetical protein ACHAW5_001747 [Stephanodiscus triporus]|uniref:Uncharacterized protein n=1 Tax=Stephanodiscus triporus TaxID=2934178 RepID=A0ABD3R0G4_9STRA